jgi:HK97 family phage major capsid protein
MPFTQEEIDALAEEITLRKSLQTTNLVNGGLLNPAQSDAFITYMFELTVLTKLRLIRMTTPKQDIDKIGVGTRLLRKASEMTTVSDAQTFTLGKVQLVTQKLVLPWDISRDTYKSNIERSGVADTVQRLMAIQAGNDVEDLAINGDSNSSDALLQANEGWLKLAKSSADTVQVMASGSGISKALFSRMIKNMPNKFKTRRSELRFYAAPNIVQDYVDQLSDRETQLGDALIQEGVRALVFGIPLVEVPLMPTDLAGTYAGAVGNHSDVLLTFPENFVTGVLEDIVVFHWFNARKDAHEFTMYLEVDFQWENLQAVVLLRDTKAST